MTGTPARDPVREAVRLVRGRIGLGVLGWRSGAEKSLGLLPAREELPADALKHLEAVARGDTVTDDVFLVAAARRALGFLRVAPELDELCSRWGGARLESGQTVMDVEEARQLALKDSVPGRATQLWKGARSEMIDTVEDELSTLTQKLHGPLNKNHDAKGAKEFLALTRDLWADAYHHAQRLAPDVKDIPGTLKHARIMEAPILATDVRPDASRHVARAVVQKLFPDQGLLKRLSVRPLPWLGSFASINEQGAPRVGWNSVSGVTGLSTLVDTTVEACVLSLLGESVDGVTVRSVSTVVLLGLLGPPVLRKLLGMGKADADRLRRAVGTRLLREARVAAVLADVNAATPEAGLDAIAEATSGDPDIVEVAALMGPWPAPNPSLGLCGVEHGARWGAWRIAGGLAGSARNAWDEDFCVRDVSQETLRRALTRGTPDEPPLKMLSDELGKLPDEGTPLAKYFEEYLG